MPEVKSGLLPATDAPDPARRHCAQAILSIALLAPVLLSATGARAQGSGMIIDDFSDPGLLSDMGTRWRGVSDQVMGGVSKASVARDWVDGRPCLRLRGDVRLENNGGFIQAALDLSPSGAGLDASGYSGLRIVARGNGEQYSLHLRTPDNTRPWQSYRAHFTAERRWRTIELPFESFAPYRLETPLDITRVRRIGLVAIGRAFHADLAVAEIGFYR